MIPYVGAQERVADVLNDRTLNMKRPTDREKAVAKMKIIEGRRLQNAQAKGRALGIPLVETLPNGGWRELVDFDAEGPVFRASRNMDAAISTAANLTWTAPYGLNGSGLIVGVWDGGMGRPTHQEFATGSRLVSVDGGAMSSHSMHVAGTDQNAYDTGFGQYNSNSSDIDGVIYNTPYLASFWACGNDRSSNPANGDTVIINGVALSTIPPFIQREMGFIVVDMKPSTRKASAKTSSLLERSTMRSLRELGILRRAP
jgi:hypothetical protein